MKIGITGGCGFVGTNLALHLARQGHEVKVLDSGTNPGCSLNEGKLAGALVCCKWRDIRISSELSYLSDCEVILHCAALVSSSEGEDSPDTYFQTNVLGTANILERARQHNQALIYWSSSKVYSSGIGMATHARYAVPVHEYFPVDGGDRSIYGTTKLMGDLLCQEYARAYGMRIWVNRFGCLAGPHQWGRAAQGWVSWFVIAAELGLPVELFGWGGRQVRDVLLIDDLLALIDKQLALIDQADGSVFNVGGGPTLATTPLELVKIVQEVTGKRLDYTVTDAPRRADFRSYTSNLTKVQERFGWRPTVTVRQGVEQIHRWVLENRQVLERMHLTPAAAPTL